MILSNKLLFLYNDEQVHYLVNMNIYLFYKKVINKKSLNEKKCDKSEDNDEIIIVKPIKKQKRKKMIIKLL